MGDKAGLVGVPVLGPYSGDHPVRFRTPLPFEVVMLLPTDGETRRVWGVIVGARHEIQPAYLCEDAREAGHLAKQHNLHFGEEAWPVELRVSIARVD